MMRVEYQKEEGVWVLSDMDDSQKQIEADESHIFTTVDKLREYVDNLSQQKIWRAH